MMKFIGAPLKFLKEESSVKVSRDLDSRIKMLDNLIELIVFTPKGSFAADPDFGFEYWCHEYSNLNHNSFNNGHSIQGLSTDVTKMECQESIRKSLQMYEPQMKNIIVNIEINPLGTSGQRRKVMSKYEVKVRVNGTIDDGLGVMVPYEKSISFFMEPTVKQYSI